MRKPSFGFGSDTGCVMGPNNPMTPVAIEYLKSCERIEVSYAELMEDDSGSFDDLVKRIEGKRKTKAKGKHK
jgi:hypothetical protein